MINRISTNWTFTRVIFLIMGITVIVHSVSTHQWFGIAFGSYFAAMGLFAIGCAAGNCYTDYGETQEDQNLKSTTQDVIFEEVKSK